MRVLFDTNILIDVLAHREPFYADSAALWALAERGVIDGVASAVSFTDIYYIVGRLQGEKIARRALKLLRDAFVPVACDALVIHQAIDDVQFKDFEDAVQYLSAIHCGATCLVSRNPDHFPKSTDCPVLTPSEFLAVHAFE